MNYIYSINKTAPWNRMGVMLAFVAILMAAAPVRAIADMEVVPESLPAESASVAEEAPAPAPAKEVKVASAVRLTAPKEVANVDSALRVAETGYKVVRTYNNIPSTAYTSRPEETDDTPFIAADGTHVFDGMVAANFLPFGTKLRIPDLYGDKVFTVHDRMNKRYHYKVDIWMDDLQKAYQHGLRTVTIEIVEPVEEAAA
jgi:3D (Asp-Asp-Asp) domain-containing protein